MTDPTVFIRRDGKVHAKVVAENDETVAYWAAWPDKDNNPVYNFTACSKERFDREYRHAA